MKLPYTVYWEGSVPQKATRQKALCDLWVAHLTGCPATIRGGHIAMRSDQVKRSDFKTLSVKLQNAILLVMHGYLLEQIADFVTEVTGDRPDWDKEFSRWDASNRTLDNHLVMGPVECYCEISWCLNQPFAKYLVGVNTEDDFTDLVNTPAEHIAVEQFALAHYRVQLKEKIMNAACLRREARGA